MNPSASLLMPDSGALVLPLEAVGLEALAAVGGKNASLGEMLRALAAEGVRVPDDEDEE